MKEKKLKSSFCSAHIRHISKCVLIISASDVSAHPSSEAQADASATSTLPDSGSTMKQVSGILIKVNACGVECERNITLLVQSTAVTAVTAK